MFKNELIFRKTLINAAGMLGFAPDLRAPIPCFPSGGWDDFGAFVTNPISQRPRALSSNGQVIEYPGGLLLHTGLPNPGFSGAVKQYSRRWAFSPLPVIVHLMVDRPEETARMVRNLESLENILAVELGFAPRTAAEMILMTVEMCQGELPLIVQLPFAQMPGLGSQLIQRGAAALSFAAPRGCLPGARGAEGKDGQLTGGRLYGPGLFPQSLDLLRSLARLGLPVIAGVGVYHQQQALEMLAAGALAVQLDTVLWV